MKKNILTSLFILIGFTMFGQLSYSPDPLEFTSDIDVTRAEYKFTITNTGSEMEQFWWSVDRGNSIDDWTYAICDINQCYIDGLESCPCSIPNELAAGASFEFKIYLIANENVSSADIKFNVTGDCDGNVIDLEIPMNISATGSTSSEDLENDASGLRVYPNPSTDYFQITNDTDVSEIVVSNIIGKKVIETSHYKGESHNVSYLDKGIYLVRMVDENSNILDVKRITIE